MLIWQPDEQRVIFLWQRLLLSYISYTTETAANITDLKTEQTLVSLIVPF